jgi:5-methylcytosine-specific restriction endonuclease McrA
MPLRTLTVEEARAAALAKLAELGQIPEIVEARAAEKAQQREKQRARYLARSEAARERDREKSKRYRAANLDRLKARLKAWYETNKERHARNVKEWKKKNPDCEKDRQATDERKAYLAVQRHRRRCAGGSHKPADLLAILKLQKHRCAYCRDSLKKDRGKKPSGMKRPRWHMDHIVPIVKGGTNDPANIQALCPSCNQRKHAKDPLVFAREIGRLL